MAEIPANRERIEAEAEALRLLLSSDVWNSEAGGTKLPHGTSIVFEKMDGKHQWKATLLGDKVLESDRLFGAQNDAKLDAQERLKKVLVNLTENLLPPSQVD